MNASDGNSLGTIGIETRGLFSSLTTASKKAVLASHSFDPEQLRTDFERFELWAANLGLNAPGHGSLDYRLRDWEVADNVVRRLLKDVRDALADVAVLLSELGHGDSDEHGERALPSDNNSLAPVHTSGSSDSGEQEDDLRALGYGSGDDDVDSFTESLEMHGHKISDALNRLYRIATKIRNPATRHLSDQVLSLQQIDLESGVDLLKIYADFDKRHINELLDRRERGMDEREVTQQDIESRRSRKAHFLVSRLAQGNMVRRKQFYQWRRHRLKLEMASYSTSDALGEGAVPSSMQLVPPSGLALVTLSAMGHSLPTTATMLNVQGINWEEDKSVVSVSEYTVNANASEDDSAEFPDPPTKKRGTKHFECPYCFTICPNAYLATREAWRSHLIRDLRPYMCTYEECVSGQEIYATRQDWIQHENSSHRRLWRCLEHTDATFNTRAEYEAHLQREHAEVARSLGSLELLKAGESTEIQATRPCAFCGKELGTALELQSHMAVHLERVAAFSLPRSTGQEQESDAGSNWSDQVNGAAKSFQSDLLFSYDAEKIGDNAATAQEAEESASIAPHVLENVTYDNAIMGKLQALVDAPDFVKDLILKEAKAEYHSDTSTIFATKKVPPRLSFNQIQSVSHAFNEWKRVHEPNKNLNTDIIGALQAFLTFLMAEAGLGRQQASIGSTLLQMPSYNGPTPIDATDQERNFASQYGWIEISESDTALSLQEACLEAFKVKIDYQIAKKLCSTFSVDGGDETRRQFDKALDFLKAWVDLFGQFSNMEEGIQALSIADFSKALERFGYRLRASFIRIFFLSSILGSFPPSTLENAEGLRMTFSQFFTSCTLLKQCTDVFKKFDEDRDGYITLSFEETLDSWIGLCVNPSNGTL